MVFFLVPDLSSKLQGAWTTTHHPHMCNMLSKKLLSKNATQIASRNISVKSRRKLSPTKTFSHQFSSIANIALTTPVDRLE